MNASTSRKRDCRLVCLPERELAEEEVKAECEEMTIVNERKLTASAIGEEVITLPIYWKVTNKSRMRQLQIDFQYHATP